jgi:carbonic anhydrase
LNVPRVSLGGSLLQSIHLPVIGNADLGGLAFAAVALCFVASAESLLSAVATDKLHTGPRANLHKELVGQGIGNTLSGLLGGLPITGVVVRSTANITAGAQTRFSAVLHGVWVLLFVSFLPFLLTRVPLAALAGLLVYTGFKLVNKHHIDELRRRGELWVYIITVVAIVATNLLLGLGIGLGVAALRLLWVLTHVSVRCWEKNGSWTVKVEGTLTFSRVPVLMTELTKIPAGSEVVIDLELRYLDHAGFDALNSWKSNHERTGGKVIITHLEELWQRTNTRIPASSEVPALDVTA